MTTRGLPPAFGSSRGTRTWTTTGEGDGVFTTTAGIGASRVVDMLSGEQLPRIC